MEYEGFVYWLQDSGTMDTEVRVVEAATDKEVVVTLDGETASLYREVDGSFSDRGFKGFVEDVVAYEIGQLFEEEG